MNKTIHLIGNAHLDPVWLWDAREGLTEGVTTCRTILDLMDEDPDLTFVRGESAIYEYIEKADPVTFARIAGQVRRGRWDVVGGTYIQPDTNLPAGETILRHLLRGQRYFRDRFGKTVKVAWAADSFGHAAGLPDLLTHGGIESFAFSRPPDSVLPIEKAAFWWVGAGGSRLLAYRVRQDWYGTERFGVSDALDAALEESRRSGLSNVACFWGLGNHGGGPTRRQLADIRRWADANAEVRVVHSGLHRLFSAIREELHEHGGDAFLPTHRGELGYVLRGCYSSVARFKFAYRRAESHLRRAESIDTAVSLKLERAAADLSNAWDSVLFNSFHDILPGTSIERAMDEQIEQVGGIAVTARNAEFHALRLLADHIDTQVQPVSESADHPSGVPLLVFNPHSHHFKGFVELEAGLDYRPIWPYENKSDRLPVRLLNAAGHAIAFQTIPTENAFSMALPWRRRVLVPVELPPMGWSTFEMAWVEGVSTPQIPADADTARSPSTGVIETKRSRVEAQVDRNAIHVLVDGRSLFGRDGLSVAVFEDPWGSWGGMKEERESTRLSTIQEKWNVKAVQTLETGPFRARLWTRFAGASGRSWMDLTFDVHAGQPHVEVFARVLWNERSARLRLIMPAGGEAEFEVPGGVVRRGAVGEVPGGRWARVFDTDGRASMGFASDALYSFECEGGALRATVCRASRYATNHPLESNEEQWRPAVDAGELKFRFVLCPGDSDMSTMASHLEAGVVAMPVTPATGHLPRQGSLMALEGAELLALKPAEDGSGFVVRVRYSNLDGQPQTGAVLSWHGTNMRLPRPLHAIQTVLLEKRLDTWRMTEVDATEEAVD